MSRKEVINKVYYFKKLFLYIIFSFLLASCVYPIVGQGYAKLVDDSCRPIKNKRIQVNNIQSAVFINSGHLTKDSYTTDKHGQFDFDIEKNANKLVIFLLDEKGGERSKWNWYTTTSNNDEVLFFFDESRSSVKTNYKTELLKTSVNQPLVIVYPYKKDTCNNDNTKLDEYNILKGEAERKAEKDAAEKARIDAIKVVIPKYKTKAYGIIKFSIEPLEPRRSVYTITENTNLIKKEQQKLYTSFGIFVTASETAVLHYSSDITYNIIYPNPGLTNPSTGITTKSRSIDYWKMHSDRVNPNMEEFIISMQFRHQWQIKSGVWLFQIKYKDSFLLEQSFIVE